MEFDVDKKGFRTIPKLSSVKDFFDKIVKTLYLSQYKSLKLYKGRYYKYTENKWELIDSLEEEYMYIDRYDVFKMKVRKIVLKRLEKIVKANSEVSFTVSTVDEVSKEDEQKEEEEEEVVTSTGEDSPVLRSAMQFSLFNKRKQNESFEYTSKSFFNK